MARRNLIGNRKGAAMVELAIILPILLIVLFAIIEFGLILYDKALITNASREGARQGIVFRWDVIANVYDPFTEAEIQGVVNTYLNNGNLLIPNATPTTTAPDGICTGAGVQIRVRVAYNYIFFVLPNFITSITGPINLIGETLMRCE
jgi:Flp pilus assembly protein TadG